MMPPPSPSGVGARRAVLDPGLPDQHAPPPPPAAVEGRTPAVPHASSPVRVFVPAALTLLLRFSLKDEEQPEERGQRGSLHVPGPAGRRHSPLQVSSLPQSEVRRAASSPGHACFPAKRSLRMLLPQIHPRSRRRGPGPAFRAGSGPGSYLQWPLRGAVPRAQGAAQ